MLCSIQMVRKIMLNNPGFAAAPEIKNLSDAYFQPLGLALNYFGHTTVYRDGRFNFLASNAEWVKYIAVEEALPPCGYTIFDTVKNSIKFPRFDSGVDVGWPDRVMRVAHESFGFNNLMLIYRKYDDQLQIFGFDLCDKKSVEKFLNHFDVFEKFIFYYKDKAQALIKTVSQQPLQTSETYLNSYDSNPCLQKNGALPSQYFLRHKEKEYSVSPREYDCLALMAHGNKIKALARLFKLSSRTIETHLDNLKRKLCVHTLSEAIEIYWKNRII
ncbi:MAG TPA: helix-turn-helix transcriptional regulator [Gammaproteobacteria bacterium]|nr:helix-turn-helix transcriptional regulator [Gammaproteobacteria bacterium]